MTLTKLFYVPQIENIFIEVIPFKNQAISRQDQNLILSSSFLRKEKPQPTLGIGWKTGATTFLKLKKISFPCVISLTLNPFSYVWQNWKVSGYILHTSHVFQLINHLFFPFTEIWIISNSLIFKLFFVLVYLLCFQF